jgi:hypothetical protein
VTRKVIRYPVLEMTLKSSKPVNKILKRDRPSAINKQNNMIAQRFGDQTLANYLN